MSFKHLIITLFFATKLMASASAPTSKQITVEEFRDTVMPDIVRYFDLKAYGGEHGELALPENGVYKKSDLLDLEEDPEISDDEDNRTALNKERLAWKEAITLHFDSWSYRRKGETTIYNLVYVINGLDINRKNQNLCVPTSKGHPRPPNSCILIAAVPLILLHISIHSLLNCASPITALFTLNP